MAMAENWSESVEDLLTAGDTDAAISLLESVISNLQIQTSSESYSHPQLPSALNDLARLYSSKGFSLKADQLHSRASTIQHRLLHSTSSAVSNGTLKQQPCLSPNSAPIRNESSTNGNIEKSTNFLDDTSQLKEPSDDGSYFEKAETLAKNIALEAVEALSPREKIAPNNLLYITPIKYMMICNTYKKSRGNLSVSKHASNWEAIAERSPDELLSSQCLPGVSKISLEATKPKTPTPKRRGRGTFSYKKDELYSDNLSDKSVIDDLEDGDVSHSSERNTEKTTWELGNRAATYGTRHVLVLADFSPSTKTIELEKLYENFRDRGVVIRWVNDTTALAVFRTPSIALEARNCISCPFRVYILDDNNDELINTISPKDLEPPRPRPKTSARTAQRLIAQGMGLKLPSASFGSRELRKQEGDRRNRIVTRQRLKDDAWGDDED
ncbi:hypothetical protein F8388_020600 [Cannabis sativa]|uniref:Coiled-coil domain-containing protein R3HCC1L n=1 Tax=Cannabis sativa TaxID=3483 RepID=A0A7J6ERD7_CANSA|nr:hypothetical protein F8388_020600 [Cannabis sativa]